MDNFLIDNFIWLGFGLVALLIGIKVVFGTVLHMLMEKSEAAELARKNPPPDQGQG
jgi:hypothetical protein